MDDDPLIILIINTIFPNKKKKRKKLPKTWASPFARSGAGIEASLSEALCARARTAPPGVRLSRCNGSIAMNAVVRYYVEPPSAEKDNLIPISRRVDGGRRGGETLSRWYRASTIPISRYHRSWTATLNPRGLSPLGRERLHLEPVISKFTCPRFLSYDEHVIFPLFYPFFLEDMEPSM